jgi:hypothetical protein
MTESELLAAILDLARVYSAMAVTPVTTSQETSNGLLPFGWLEQDDARRAATMAAGKRRTAELRLALIDRRMGSGSRVDSFATSREATPRTTRARRPYHRMDPDGSWRSGDRALHGVRAVRGVDVKSKREDGASRQQEDANSQTHAACLLVHPNGMCRAVRRGLSHESGPEPRVVTVLGQLWDRRVMEIGPLVNQKRHQAGSDAWRFSATYI